MSNDPIHDRLSILVADDSADNRLLLRHMFRRFELNPDFVLNGKEAVDAAQTKKYDLIFLDIQMPVMCGLEAVKTLRAKGLGTSIIALTAHAMVTFQKECLEAGFTDIITKPFKMEDLAKIVASTNPA